MVIHDEDGLTEAPRPRSLRTSLAAAGMARLLQAFVCGAYGFVGGAIVFAIFNPG